MYLVPRFQIRFFGDLVLDIEKQKQKGGQMAAPLSSFPNLPRQELTFIIPSVNFLLPLTSACLIHESYGDEALVSPFKLNLWSMDQ